MAGCEYQIGQKLILKHRGLGRVAVGGGGCQLVSLTAFDLHDTMFEKIDKK